MRTITLKRLPLENIKRKPLRTSALIVVCKSPMMHCASVMRPTLIVLSVLALVFAAVSVYFDTKSSCECAAK